MSCLAFRPVCTRMETPVRAALLPEPQSGASTLTPLSSMSSARQSSSPSTPGPSTASSQQAPLITRASTRSRNPPKPLQSFFTNITPQKALPAKMKLVGDSKAGRRRSGKGVAKGSQDNSDAEEGYSSEMEVWSQDFGELAPRGRSSWASSACPLCRSDASFMIDLDESWSPEEQQELLLCLREAGERPWSSVHRNHLMILG